MNMDAYLHSNLQLELTETYSYLKCEQSGALLALFTALTITLMKIYGVEWLLSRDRMALGLSYVIIISSWVTTNIFAMSKFMRGLASLERIVDWTDSTDLEPEWTKAGDPSSSNWPSSGKIEARNLIARYRKNLPRVLKGLDFTIQSKEKVGIVGRTGSGKSTLILSLLRILEQDSPESPDEPPSQILIDGKVIGDLGLSVARRAVTLIPQEPFLLSGTVRSNVDPFKRHKDDEIIQVLKNTNVYNSLLHSSRQTSQETPDAAKDKKSG